jgi:hypothetical protein
MIARRPHARLERDPARQLPADAACRPASDGSACYYEQVVGDSTLGDVRHGAEPPLPRWGRRFGLTLITVVVAIGVVGGFGVRSRTVSAEGGGYVLRVTYPQLSRAGLDVPWKVHVHHAGGFASDLTLAISADYFRMFETQGFRPDPDSADNDGNFVYLTFTKPSGVDFVLDYDAYIQPASQLGKSAVVKVMLGDTVMVQASLRTWLLP